MEHGHHSHHQIPVDLIAGPLDIAGFVVILSYSFLSSFHCAGMCAPLVCSQLGKFATWKSRGIWLYNAGRLISYPIGGALLGFLGQQSSHWKALGSTISFALGSSLILVSVFIAFQKKDIFTTIITPSGFIPTKILTKIYQLVPRSWQSFILGFLTIFLPCTTLTPALMMAAGSQSPLSGSLMMLGFFLGTLPVMILAPMMPQQVLEIVPQKWISKVVALFLFLSGLITILRVYH